MSLIFVTRINEAQVSSSNLSLHLQPDLSNYLIHIPKNAYLIQRSLKSTDISDESESTVFLIATCKSHK